MIVNNINNCVSFGTSYKKKYTNNFDHRISHESSTCFFKYDLQWNKLFDRIIDKYKDTSKVNIYSLACSDGSEAFSIAMLLITKLGDKAQKYFPIIAVDFDKEVMENANNGYIDLCAEDELKINKYTNNQLNRFLERSDYTFMSDKMGSSNRRVLLTRFKIKPELIEKVKFVEADINDYIEEISNTNNVIFCRNCWPYLYRTTDEFCQKLSNKIDEHSFLVIGNFDSIYCPMNITKNSYGFSMLKDYWNVFDKSGSDYFDDLRSIRSPELEDD